jgi:ABC-type oligopeptide transport system substrate-binding subunit
VRGESRPPTIGAFMVADAGKRPLRLVRNPRYFDAADTGPAAVVLNAAPDPDAAVARFVRGDTDLVVGDGLAGLDAARRLAPRGTLRSEATWGSYAYLANLQAGPLADPRVRRALAMAVDRETLVRGVFNRAEVVPLVSLVPPDAGAGPVAPVPDWAALDLPARRALALQLLAAAGFGFGHPLRLTLLLPPGADHDTVAAAVARDWALSGVALDIRRLAPPAMRAALAAGTYDLALVERTAPAAQALFFLRPFTCAGSGGRYCNPGADALIESARAMADEGARAAALAHAETAMLADTPMIPLFVPLRWALVSRRVGGWTENQGGQHPLAALSLGD